MPETAPPPPLATSTLDARILDRLGDLIESRKGGDPEASHTAKLFARGTAKIAQKTGEEAVEAIIEAVRGDREKLAEESADLLFHLLVLWADAGLKPLDIWQALERRQGLSGIAEKRLRAGKTGT